MKKELTCIVCPVGCTLQVTLEEGKVVSVEGNTCPRGKVYGENECTNPLRTVTTTVRCSDGGLVSVKTKAPISKEKVMECMAILNQVVVPLPISVGDVILEDVFGSPVVATDRRK